MTEQKEPKTKRTTTPATSSPPSPKDSSTSDSPRLATQYEAAVLETLQSIDASLKTLVAIIPKAQTVVPGFARPAEKA